MNHTPMKLSLFIILIFLLAVVASAFIYNVYRNKNSKGKGEVSQSSSFDFYSINDGNQNQLIYAPDYNKEWFDEFMVRGEEPGAKHTGANAPTVTTTSPHPSVRPSLGGGT